MPVDDYVIKIYICSCAMTGPDYETITYHQVRRWQGYLNKPRSKDGIRVMQIVRACIPRSYKPTWKAYAIEGIDKLYAYRIVRELIKLYPDGFKYRSIKSKQRANKVYTYAKYVPAKSTKPMKLETFEAYFPAKITEMPKLELP